MELELDEAMAVLERTPKAVSALLGGLPEAWLSANEGGDTFSPRDVVGHLLHGEETDWPPRVEIILEKGTSQPFEPFERFGFREKFRDLSLGELLARFQERRAKNLERLRARSLSAADLERGGSHPELGPVKLRQLLATWVVHDLAHVRQIARVMAKQYRDQVGPWEQYLRVLKE